MVHENFQLFQQEAGQDAAVGGIRGVDVPDEELEADRVLLRQRYRLSKDLTRYKIRTG